MGDLEGSLIWVGGIFVALLFEDLGKGCKDGLNCPLTVESIWFEDCKTRGEGMYQLMLYASFCAFGREPSRGVICSVSAVSILLYETLGAEVSGHSIYASLSEVFD